ncbi:MAG: hypothetical protein PWQ88_874 [Candidatus Methanomethylophilaceae archaeon]|nr:hypothetical protein [Candidatus Methanomethylophilaceae archaeon]MDI3541998.1 hypothetical protein [Candidatus Methanomethylophilaceae archaeon]HIJ00465.1 amidohydrolase family protein [Candidatus Methanomethylophilaceae archaeon]
MRYLAGQIFDGCGFYEGYLGVERGVISEIGDGAPPDRAVLTGIIVPAFIDCHTHVADASVRMSLDLSLEELVAPPEGLKHRALRNMGYDELRLSIHKGMNMMAKAGTSRFLDFREGGFEGVKALLSCRGPPYPFTLGRPARQKYNEEEVDRILDYAEGIGVSAISDWDYTELESLAEHVHRRGKVFALHASESRREDLDKILALEPKFLVHMSNATDRDLHRCADECIPVIVCPRSNLFMGIVPPLKRMVEACVEIGLGTDNFMNNDGDMRAEIETAARLLRSQGANPALALDAAFRLPRKLLNLKSELPFRTGEALELVVFDHHNADPMCDLLFRSGNGKRMVCI